MALFFNIYSPLWQVWQNCWFLKVIILMLSCLEKSGKKAFKCELTNRLPVRKNKNCKKRKKNCKRKKNDVNQETCQNLSKFTDFEKSPFESISSDGSGISTRNWIFRAQLEWYAAEKWVLGKTWTGLLACSTLKILWQKIWQKMKKSLVKFWSTCLKNPLQ